jgi:hypothetical protein
VPRTAQETRPDYLSSFFGAAAAGQRVSDLDLFADLVDEVTYADLPAHARMGVILVDVVVVGCCGERIACQRLGVYSVCTQGLSLLGSGLGVLPTPPGPLIISSYILPRSCL